MIGLISAIDEELQRLLEHAQVDQTVVQSGITFHLGSFEDRQAILLRTGVGKVNAAVATQILIDRFGVDSVVFTGLAGGLVPNLCQGDMVVSSFVVQHDIDLTAFGRRPGEIPDLTRLFEADPRLVRAMCDAWEAMEAREEVDSQMMVGTIATGDSFIADAKRIRYLQREFGAVATEMEGGAVGQVCAMNRVPFVVVRVISDTSEGSAAGEFVLFLEHASDLTCRLLIEAVPRIAQPEVLVR
ncbi:5'-methylthioadenosine/adenosylhomocysteine nucleosidase [candidate division GN15 bacterium]|nr:5'-methylthioadenosine/adenosylhomocysteine nucleosidase [candidate division GN15 bacterium]